MAVRSIISIDINDGKFRDFKKLYDQYQSALKSSPAAWALVNKNIDGSRGSFDKLVDKMAAANVQQKLIEKAQERADRLTRTTAERWQGLARSTRDFASNIGAATTSILKWASITGVISGLIGAGGLFGIDRLAIGAAGARRSSLGLGANIGNQAAFNANFGRLVDPQSFLESVAGARFDVNKRTGLISAGLSANQIDRGDTADISVALLRSLKRLADTTNPSLFSKALEGRRLDQFASPTDLERLRNTKPEEFERLISQYGQRKGQFDLPDGIAEKWQNLVTQLDNAGKGIETTLVKGLVGLAPGLTRLSEAISKTVGTLVEKGGPLENWTNKLGDALERFARYVGTEEFQKNIEAFVNGIGKLAQSISWLTSFLPSGSTPSSRHPNFGHRHRKTAEDAALEQLGGNPVIGGLAGLGRSFWDRAHEISSDQLLDMVRSREGSGDSAVSPKGAIGRYQITPDTARTYGLDPSRLTDPEYNSQGARKILGDLARKYHGNVKEVLAAYNAGQEGSRRFRESGDDPRYLPAETQKYIRGSDGIKVTVQDVTGGSVNTSVNALKD